MTCPFCGKEHSDDTLFCPNTGKKIEMFRLCSSLETINLSGCNTTNVVEKDGMFDGCESLRKVIMLGCNKRTVDMIRQALNEAGLTQMQIIV